MKRLFSIIIAAAMLLSMFSIIVTAVDPAMVIIDSASGVKRGDTVTLTVSVSGSAPAKSMSVTPFYDSNVLTMISGTWLLSNALLSDPWNISTGDAVIAYGSETDINGGIFLMVFKVNDAAPYGDTSVSCEVIIKNGTVSIPVNTLAGTVSVACSHENVTNTEEVKATCNSIGYSAGVYCNDCHKYISGHTEVPKTDSHQYGTCKKVDDSSHKRICTICGKEEVSSHSWNDGVVTLKPTHLIEGKKLFVCTACGAEKTEDIPKLSEHSYGEWAKYDEKQHKKTCSCGDVQYGTHTWNSGAVTIAPTCKDTGLKTYTCSLCGETKTETVPKTESHKYGDCSKVDGSNHKRTCTVCGKEDISAHTWNSGTVTTAPTCKDTGLKTYTCSLCGETKTETVSKAENHKYGACTKIDETSHKHTCTICGKEETVAHSWNLGTITVPSTEEREGIRTYKCRDCNAERTETIPKLDHTHEYGNEWHNDATYHWVVCHCGEKNKISEHEFGDGTTIKKATCLEDGTVEYKCKICGYSKFETAKGTHEPGEWETARVVTCTDDGIRIRKCCICNAIIEENVTASIGHSFGDWTVVKDEVSHRCFVCDYEETRKIEKSVEIIKSADGSIIITVGDAILPEGTEVKTDVVTKGLSDEEKSLITDVVKRNTGDGESSFELIEIRDIFLRFESSAINPHGLIQIKTSAYNGADDLQGTFWAASIDDSGNFNVIPAENKDGCLVFSTDRCGRYALVKSTHEATTTSNASTTIIVVCVIVGVIAVISVVVVIIARRKKHR